MSGDPVAVIVTVRNEAATIGPLLDSLLRGSRVPDEIVVVDGGSTDGTLTLLSARASRDPRLRVLEAPGNIAAGRNAAVRAARHELIACTDAGVAVEPTWLERIVAPLDTSPGIDAVAGFYHARAASAFERAAGVVSVPRLAEVDPKRFLPSARSLAFRRAAWSAVGGFDESLAYAEDTWFALALRRAGKTFAFAPDAVVLWRPRGDLGSFLRQYARYGAGDAAARIRGAFYAKLALQYGMGALLLVAGFWSRVLWWALAAGVVAFSLREARRAVGRARPLEALFLVPALKVARDQALLAGYLRGRLRPRPTLPVPVPPESGFPPAAD